MSDADTDTDARARGIFRYDAGEGPVYGDVMRLQFALQEACPGGDIDAFDALLATLDNDKATDRQVLDASLRIADITGATFGLGPFDPRTGTGLSTQERVGLMAQFLVATAPSPGEEGAADPDEGRDEPSPVA